MRLLCIHSGKIDTSDGLPTIGGGLKEGQVYTSNGIIYKGLSDVDATCYFIKELSELKRCERFIPLCELDDEVELLQDDQLDPGE
jgi:hypothetical protein